MPRDEPSGRARQRLGDAGSSAPPSRFLRHALFWLRWATLGALLVLAVAQPATSRAGLPIWAILLLFAAYNLLHDLARGVIGEPPSFARAAILDLPATGLAYFLGAQPGGILYVLFVLAVVCAAASLPLRGTLLYTATAAVIVAVVEPTLPMWPELAAAGEGRETSARVVLLAIVGVGTTILAQRLTLEQAAVRANRDEAARLAELDRLRASFVAAISHDLQTPLAAMRVSLGLLGASAADRLNQDERALLDSAQRNNRHLGLLIDDLLALNELEAGALHLDRHSLDLRAIVADAIATIHPLLEDKGQILEASLPPAAMWICGDARRLGQALTNLLHNAHRHTPSGTHIMIGVREAGEEILLSVSDTGPGMETVEAEAAFQRFHRLPAHGGSGLGLPIARELVERHSGRVWIESQPGQGTTVHAALPRLQKEACDDAEAADR
jgi:signal transduction histidine kinase